MKQLYIQATYENETEGYVNHVTDIEETDVTSMQELYHRLKQNERGHIKKMYQDTKDGTFHVGYIVRRRAKYEDTGETYIEAVWFHLLEPVKVMREVTEYASVKRKAA